MYLAKGMLSLTGPGPPSARDRDLPSVGGVTLGTKSKFSACSKVLTASAHCRKPDLLSLVQSLVKLCERGVDRCRRLTHG